MQNWAGEENEAMKGYIMAAVGRMNRDSVEDTGKIAINEDTLGDLMQYLRCATDDMTADEAQQYYLQHGYADVCDMG